MINFTQPNYIELSSKIKERRVRLVLWIGAGLSKKANLPLWNELKSKLVEDVRSVLAQIPLDCRNAKDEKNFTELTVEKNPWVSFQRLSTSFRTTYESGIKKYLTPIDKVSPEVYKDIWQIPCLQGVVSLNLDSLASQGFADTGKRDIRRFLGNKIGPNIDALKDLHRPFLVQLHGEIDDAKSWVFTHDEIQKLLADQAYTEFCKSIFSTYTVLFLGVSVEDLAISAHFERLKDAGISLTGNYWLTPNANYNTIRFCEENGIHPIFYTPDDANHNEVDLCIKSFLPHVEKEIEEDYPPAIDSVFADLEIESKNINEMTEEELRYHLNSQALSIFSTDTHDSFIKFSDFISQNHRYCHRAWYIPSPGEDTVFGYNIEYEIASGSFGTVYKANKDGKEYALKVLNNSYLKNKEMMQSFRRGIKCMRILTKNNIPRTAHYHSCSEIPAMVVMDFVSGQNLKNYISSHSSVLFCEILEFAIQIGETLREAHKLAERILHRDLRPENIMVTENHQTGECQLTILDFDMASHKNAYEKTIVNNSANFIAPELMSPIRDVSTRSSLVDSFGFGLLLYYLIAKKEPVVNMHKSTEWNSHVAERCNQIKNSPWRSVPYILARVIIASTKDTQSERIDLTQIHNELCVIRDITNDNYTFVSPILFAEEILRRTESIGGKQITIGADEVVLSFLNYKIQFQEEPNTKQLRFNYSRLNSGGNERGIRRDVAGFNLQITNNLTAGGFVSIGISHKETSLKIYADLNVANEHDINKSAKCIDKIIQQINSMYV